MAKILIVDDSVSLRKLVAGTLATAHHEIVEAQDGATALAQAKQKTFDLIISDVNMPQMNGLEFLRQVRKLAEYRTVPVLMLTTEMDPGKKKEAKDAGATGWIVKPFDPGTLLATIRKVLD